VTADHVLFTVADDQELTNSWLDLDTCTSATEAHQIADRLITVLRRSRSIDSGRIAAVLRRAGEALRHTPHPGCVSEGRDQCGAMRDAIALADEIEAMS